MKNTLKILIEQSSLIAFLILVGISIEEFIELLNGEPFYLDWFIPVSIVIVSVLSSLPSLLILKERETDGKNSRWFLILHFLLVYVIVMGSGYFFRWYTTFQYFVYKSLIYVCIYFAVWFVTLLFYRHDEKMINTALEAFRDDE